MVIINSKLKKIKTKIFADGANINEMIKLNSDPIVKGFTTNPTLLRKNGISNYKEFAIKILKKIKKKSVSFEVIADDLNEIERQALEISSWGKNVYVKIPITNSKGKSCHLIIKKLSKKGIKINITAIFTINQINMVIKNLNPKTNAYISIFAGRIADTGIDPSILIKKTLKKINNKKWKVLWASPREIYNLHEANKYGCHIITVTNDLLNKIKLLTNKNLDKFSLETVKMFYNDAKKSKLQI